MCSRYIKKSKKVLFLGMNPGPWGMAQTGVPFGQVNLAKEFLGKICFTTYNEDKKLTNTFTVMPAYSDTLGERQKCHCKGGVTVTTCYNIRGLSVDDKHVAAQIRYLIDDKHLPVQVRAFYLVSMDDKCVMMTKLLS